VRVSVCVWDSEGGGGSSGERGRRGEGWGWGGVGGFKLNLKRATLGAVARLSRGVWTRIT
jgi:hypothetical protein